MLHRCSIHYWGKDSWQLLLGPLPNCWNWRYVGFGHLHDSFTYHANYQVRRTWRKRFVFSLRLWFPWKFVFCLGLSCQQTSYSYFLPWLYVLNRSFQLIRYRYYQVCFGRSTFHRWFLPSTHCLGHVNFGLWWSSWTPLPRWFRRFGLWYSHVQRNYRTPLPWLQLMDQARHCWTRRWL